MGRSMSDTAALDPIELLPQGGLDPILTEARSLLAAIPAEASRYDALAAAARIYQDLGSRLSSMVYQHANSRSGHGLVRTRMLDMLPYAVRRRRRRLVPTVILRLHNAAGIPGHHQRRSRSRGRKSRRQR